MVGRATAPLLILVVAGGCGPPSGRFSDTNARAHVNMLAGAIGSRPAGTDANRRARDYLTEQLRSFGLEVRVQRADASRPELGLTARVHNIIATRAGASADAIALIAHYDSNFNTPGATDDGLGVAVVLEAARLLAARPNPRRTLAVLLTDAEELGLMGAAAAVTDPFVRDRVRAFINVESIGSRGPGLLFEAGPDHDGIVRVWARVAPQPRGSSYSTEIYRRLPNDTDFTVFKRLGAPGLNFAPIDDSYAYHTARDVPERLATATIRHVGDTVLAVADALDTADLRAGGGRSPVFTDIATTTAIVYSRRTGRVLTIVALALGLVAWLRLIGAARRGPGLIRFLVTAVWGIVAAAACAAALVGVTWGLRASREVYHPWHAHPDRQFALMGIVLVAVAWWIVRLATMLPRAARATPHPSLVWAIALPAWMALAALAEWRAPAAAFLWVGPLMTAGVMLAATPLASGGAVRIASILVLAVSGTLWIPNVVTLARFTVAVMGRMPVITPVFAYAAILGLAAIMVAPPLVAVLAAPEPRTRIPRAISAMLLLIVAVAVGLAWAAPAYTYDRPLRREARFIHDARDGRAWWEVASTEPGLDLALDRQGPPTWARVDDAPPASLPLGRLPHPFVFRAAAGPTTISQAPGGGSPGASINIPARIGATARPGATTVDLDIAVSVAPPAAVALVLPPGLAPVSSDLAGIVQQGRWVATYAAPPPEGVALRATFAAADLTRLGDAAVVVWTASVPDTPGWPALPAWLPQERTVWAASATYIQPIGPILTTVDASSQLR